MSTYTQAERRLSIKTALGSDTLLLTGCSGVERISQLFAYELDLLSESESVKPADVVGKKATVTLRVDDKTERHFDGFISRFAYCGSDDRLHRYSATLVPWTWFLTLSSDCRIFQGKTVPEIVAEVFEALGFSGSDFDFAGVQGSHPRLDYCVQYRETDYNFVCRLLEKEGIFFFFRHDDGKHVLHLADSNGAFSKCQESEVHFGNRENSEELLDEVFDWRHEYQFCSGKHAHTDYNFETPDADLLTPETTRVSLPNNKKYERYDYPGLFPERGVGETEIKLRMEEEEVAHDLVYAASRCRTFDPGGTFRLVKHRNAAEEGKEYYLVSVHHDASLAGDYGSGGVGGDLDYRNSFVCAPAAVAYRPPRQTRRAVVSGAQTAVVVGPAGEEIFTDEYGRVKVQFFWDRQGQKDDKSSCWVRVAQVWAGKNWGAVHIPRIGQEVIVDFLEGDPDRPIITGRVYNADQMPPYALPDNKTQSGIKSRSTRGGGEANFNEIRFEDKKGEEELFIHAEKDQVIEVENDENHSVGRDRTKAIDRDERTTVKRNRTERVDKDESISIGGNRTEDVKKKETITVGENRSVEVGKSEDVNIADNREHSVGKDDKLSVGKQLTIEAGDVIKLSTGSASITMKKNGDIEIKGKNITINGSGKVNVKASSNVTIKGSKVAAN